MSHFPLELPATRRSPRNEDLHSLSQIQNLTATSVVETAGKATTNTEGIWSWHPRCNQLTMIGNHVGLMPPCKPGTAPNPCWHCHRSQRETKRCQARWAALYTHCTPGKARPAGLSLWFARCRPSLGLGPRNILLFSCRASFPPPASKVKGRALSPGWGPSIRQQPPAPASFFLFG